MTYTKRPRGYSLPFVLLILIMLSISLASLLFVLLSGARSTESMLGRRRLFYVCDGISRLVAVSAQDYFGQTGEPTTAGLRDFVCAQGGGCVAPILPTLMSQSPGHVVSEFQLSQVNARVVGPLDSGPFEGMSAMQDTVDMKVAAQKSSSGWKCDVTQELSLAKISMFQFFVFSDQAYTDWTPGPLMSGDGRVHANGDLCFFSVNAGLFLDRVTASGRVSSGKSGEPVCRTASFSDGARGQAPRIAKVNNPVFDTNTGNSFPIEPLAADFAVFDARDNNTATWLSASAAFNGHIQDKAHRVVNLKLPVLGSPVVQRGADAANSDVTNTSTRLLVDPMLTADVADVRSQRFAFKADIRIINGVWYVKDPTNPSDLGQAVWSDHAGDYTTVIDQGIEGGDAVGQNQLFPSGARPTRYSYYRFDAARKLTTTSISPTATQIAPTSVVSYGVLKRDATVAAAPIWQPGYWCPTTNSLNAVDAACGTSGEPFGQRLLRGTRAGFRDGHAQLRFGGTSPLTKEPNILPMNIDIAALQNALADCSARELGSFFPGTCSGAAVVAGGPRRFNGVVYIANTWPLSLANLPLVPPGQGLRGGSGTAPQRDQPAMPQALCSNVVTPMAIADAANAALGHTFADCATYVAATVPNATSVVGARPTAIRLFNARNLNRAHTVSRPVIDRDDVFINGTGANGLTIASNLPIYVLGDVNRASILGTEPPTTPAPHWVPFLVAGDVVSILSNAWADERAPWNVFLNNTRTAEETTDHMEILAGWTPTASTAYSGGVHNFPRFLENWGATSLHLKGSLVIGWASVYARWKRACCNAANYNPPARDWGFDKNLNNILNQPPGAPLFDVQATRRWKR